MKRIALGILAASAVVGAASSAYAQDTQAGAGASVGTSTAPAASATVTPAATPPPPPPPPAPAAAEKSDKDDDGMNDHDRVVGHLAVGFLGVSQLPIGSIGTGAGATVQRDNLNAPTVGVRYWLNKKIGIDAGLGLAWTGGVNSTNANGTDVATADPPSRFGGAVHFGVPIALANGKHYTFEAIPEANVGITNGSTKLGNNDVTLSGFRLDAGGRVGAEIYFGFIGVPQLSLQGSVGLNFRYESAKVSTSANGNNSSASVVTRTLGTTVQSDPWALFVNNISAFYYF